MELSLGMLVYHKKLGELVVSEIVEDQYIAAVEINKVDAIKINDTEEFFYKSNLLFRLDSFGKWLFPSENFTDFIISEPKKINKENLKEYVRKNRKKCKVHNALFKFKYIYNVTPKLKTISGNLTEILNRIRLYY